MPANEQTWRDQKKMHIFFAVSALIMGIATIWMMAADHMREWKDWQLKDRKKDAWMLSSQRDSLAAQYDAKSKTLKGDIRKLDSDAIPSEIVSKFESRVATEDVRPQDGSDGVVIAPADAAGQAQFTKLNAA